MARARFGISWAALLRSAGPIVVALLVVGLLGTVLPSADDSYYMRILLLCGIAAIGAVSLNIVLGFTGQFSLGHAGFIAIGGYLAGLLTKAYGAEHAPPAIFLGSTILGGVAAAAAGWAVGVPTLRLKGDYLAIVTLGFGEIIRSIIENTPTLGAATGLTNIPRASNFFWIFGWLVITVVFARRLLESTHGRALLAVREDEIAAEAMGIDTTEYKVRAFVISAFFAGVAGALFGSLQLAMNPKSFTFVRSIEIVTMVVLGGMGSTTGSVVAAFGLTALPEILKALQRTLSFQAQERGWNDTLVEWLQQDYKNIIYAIILVGMMLARPKGLLGRSEIWELWKSQRRAPPSESAAGEELLVADDVTIRFGGLTAVKSFSLTLRPRELVALIGPNGAGKTTVFNMLTGVYQPTEGRITVAGRSTRGLQPNQIAVLGAARTFQNIRLFKSLSVFDNVRIACHHLARASLAAAIRKGDIYATEEEWIAERSEEMLRVMALSNRRDEVASSLPYGEQRRLEIARALATGPKVLLLDEPAAGMNTREKSDLMALIRDIRDRFGVAILLIEHDMKLVMGVSERIIVLDHGETIARGSPKEIQSDPKVIAAYLGTESGGEGASASAASAAQAS
jgi:branched-chain amino acid transport system permease protein